MTAYDERSGYKERLEKAEAEIARLTEENAELKEFDLTKPDAQWREIYDDQLKRTGFFSGQLSEAKAEIVRLRDGPFEFEAAPDNGTPEEVLTYVMSCAHMWEGDARLIGNARALDIRKSIHAALAALAALKPDTGGDNG